MVKLAQEIDEFARESEYCDFHVKRVLTGYGGSVEKDAAALDEEKGKIILEELGNLHQFNDSIDNFVMRAVPSENDSTSRALKWPDDDPTQYRFWRGGPFKAMREALQSVVKPQEFNDGDKHGRRVFSDLHHRKTVFQGSGSHSLVSGEQVKPGVGSHGTHARAVQAAGPRGCGRGDHGGEQGG